MAFDNSFTAVTGQTLAAADWNTAVKGNWTASWVGTTAGDTEYYTSATAKTRVAKGTARQIYVMNAGATAPEWADLTTITAAKALVSSQAANDFFYAASASSLGRVAAGAAHTFVKYEGGAPLAGALIYKRQGGNTSNWNTPGTTSYTPAKTLMQEGSKTLSISGGVGSVTITYPEAYTNTPLVKPTIYNSFTKRCGCYVQSVSNTACTVVAFDVDSETYDVDIWWTASGI